MPEAEFTTAETAILKTFSSYGMRANEMLFFNRNGKDHPAPFKAAMKSMVSRGFLVQEARHRDAYSLSESGYQVAKTMRKRNTRRGVS
jgi:hypothetical protein